MGDSFVLKKTDSEGVRIKKTIYLNEIVLPSTSVLDGLLDDVQKMEFQIKTLQENLSLCQQKIRDEERRLALERLKVALIAAGAERVDKFIDHHVRHLVGRRGEGIEDILDEHCYNLHYGNTYKVVEAWSSLSDEVKSIL